MAGLAPAFFLVFYRIYGMINLIKYICVICLRKEFVHMGKILGSWNGMRKYLEKEMLAESLQGRIRYGCTSYVGMDGCGVFEICIDGVQIKRFSWETVNTYFIENGYTKSEKINSISEYWKDFWHLLEKYPINQRTEFTDNEFCEALEMYRNQDVQESIRSDNPIVRMFAVMDRRIGKRTLQKCKEVLMEQPDWLRRFYKLRLDSEKIN